jgi:DNA-binding MarR family transcriptional regulator
MSIPDDGSAVYRRYLAAMVVHGHAGAESVAMGATDFQALNLVGLAGAMSAGDLARATGLTTGATTRLIDRLERGGYVRRVPDPADRRRVAVQLVAEPTGLDAALAPVRGAIADVLAGYTPEQLATLFDWFRRAAAVYEKATADLMATHRDGSTTGSRSKEDVTR